MISWGLTCRYATDYPNPRAAEASADGQGGPLPAKNTNASHCYFFYAQNFP